MRPSTEFATAKPAIEPSENGGQTEPSTTLQALIGTILSPYDGRTDDNRPRVAISGADTAITGRSVTSFALLLYEFATNAAKHGALAIPSCHIDIVCSEGNGQFIVTWTELGQLHGDHETEAEGFGSLLARETVKGLPGSENSRDWRPAGLTIRLSVAKDRLIAE